MPTTARTSISQLMADSVPPDTSSKNEVKNREHATEKRGNLKQRVQSADPDDFPDGGTKAWLVVAGAICGTFATFGYVNSWGAFQSYYEQKLLSTTSPSTIAWIGSVQYALTFLPALIIGRLFDLGYFKGPQIASCALVVLSTVLVAQCTQYWQFLLCQGFASGLGSGFIFCPAVGVIAHWFKKKRGTALGFLAVGGALGGTVFPIAFRKLTIQVGFHWTMRILGLIQFVILLVPIMTMKRRLPPTKVSGGLLNFRSFKKPSLFLYTFSAFLSFLGIYTTLTFIDSSAIEIGLSEDFSFYLVAIANAASVLGRGGSGLIADRIGSLTTIIPFTLFTGLLTFIWPAIHSLGGLVAIAILYGIACGGFSALFTAPASNLGNVEDVGQRVGLFMGIIALGALGGPPISGAINRATGGFVAPGIYAGSCIVISVVFMIWARYMALGGWRGKV